MHVQPLKVTSVHVLMVSVGVSKISEKVEAVRLPTLGGIEEEALWGEAAQPPAKAAVKVPLASVPDGRAGMPAASAAPADQHFQQLQQQQRQPAATVQRDSDNSLRRLVLPYALYEHNVSAAEDLMRLRYLLQTTS